MGQYGNCRDFIFMLQEFNSCHWQVRIYEVQATGNTIPKASYSHEGPVLCVDWAKVRRFLLTKVDLKLITTT